ncbi:hypothetical protein [Arthrobacter sp. UYCo732]|uniref:hypothetical protein n=1 Tax=Arthrobacter sp. UYCo732 TaxID=3156336 RepID=UPI00339A54A5
MSRRLAPKLYRALNAAPPQDMVSSFLADTRGPHVWTTYVRATHRDLATTTLHNFGHVDVRPGELKTPPGTPVLANDLTRALDAAGAPAEGELVYNPRFGGELILARIVAGSTEYHLIGDYPWQTLTLPA